MKKLILILASFLLVNLANAHPGHEVTFLQSFMHPILGWDHLLTILIIGMMVQAYPLAKGVYLPVSFISFFTIGALLGTMIPDFNQISTLMNQFVLSTLIGLAIMNIFSKKIRFEFILLVLGIFGFVHGSVHGIELPSEQPKILAGLLLSTIFIHLAGLILANSVGKKYKSFVRYFTLTSGLIGALALFQNL